jgi:toxin ParE1/3/4
VKLVYHRSVQRDVSAVIADYDQARGSELGDAFFAESMTQVQAARRQPAKFHRFKGELRRANLSRFPYHFLFRCTSDTIRILAVRHHRRHPGYGTDRR